MSSEEVKLNNDVAVKQEHLATDSTEKNATTAQPPAQTKPAQEQTRTENLQRIQQRKLKVLAFTVHLLLALLHVFVFIFKIDLQIAQATKNGKTVNVLRWVLLKMSFH